MTCEDAQAAISAFLDDALEAGTEGPVFTHIGSCKACRTFLRQQTEIHRALGAIPAPEVPRRLDRRVLASFRVQGRSAFPLRETLAAFWSRRLAVPLPSLAVATLAVLAATAISLSLILRQEQVPMACLPAIDVYAEQPSTPLPRQ